MSVQAVEISCDLRSDDDLGCGNALVLRGVTSVNDAVEMARSAGWIHNHETGLDYCSSCKELAVILDGLGTGLLAKIEEAIATADQGGQQGETKD